MRGVNVDAVIRTLLARGLITEAGADPTPVRPPSPPPNCSWNARPVELTDLPDIAPLLPDVDVIDDLSESLDSEPRFMKLNPAAAADRRTSFDLDVTDR